MVDRLKRLQQKSDAHKVFYAITASAVTIFILFGVWGYNFVSGDSVANIASGASSITKGVEEVSRLGSNFSNAIGQLQQINDATNTNELDSINAAGAKAEYKDVFGSEQQDTTPSKNYGENPADVLY